MRRFLLSALSSALVLAGYAGAAGPADEPAAAGYRPGMKSALARCVKVHGLGAGMAHGYATGVVVSPDGLIVTAIGPYLGRDDLKIVLPDGTEHPAREVRRDETLGLVLIQVAVATPDHFAMPERVAVEPGDWVFAVGNPYKIAHGMEPLSVTLGIVALVDKLDARYRRFDFDYDGELLVLDTIVSNPGAPGGAVCTLDGKLVGIVGRQLISKDTNTHLNYAIPADRVRRLVTGESPPKAAEPAASGAAKNVDLGIRLFQQGGRKTPPFVDRVMPGSASEAAGLRPDDMLMQVDGRPVHTYRDAVEALAGGTAGRGVSLVVKRKQEVLTIHVRPGAGAASEEGKRP